MFDGKAFGKEVVAVVKAHMEKTVAPLLDQIDALRKEVQALKAVPVTNEIDPDWLVSRALHDVTPELIKLRDEMNLLNPKVEQIGVMIGEEIAKHVAQTVPADIERILAGWERPKDGVDGAPGEKGADGAPGRDGKDGIDAMDVMVDREGALVFTMSDGRMKNVGLVVGKDGEAGINGKDGAAGKDGADGVGFDDMDLVETEKGFMLRFTRGEVVKDFRLPIVTDRGVFREGSEYRKGDGVSFGGSWFIAQEGTTDKPETSKAWRLAVKRGRDGKDGELKAPRETKPVKVG